MADNELIAEFMGYALVEHPRLIYRYWEKDVMGEDGPETQTLCSEHKLQYHKSWDWLMPVVMRIETTIDKTHWIKGYWFIHQLPITAPIDQVYKYVVDFLKWYNTKKI